MSPQKAKKFSKTQNEVTVRPYIISFFYRHPVVKFKTFSYLNGQEMVHDLRSRGWFNRLQPDDDQIITKVGFTDSKST